MINLIDLAKIGLSFCLSAVVGTERQQEDKPIGQRSIMFICLGATLITIFTLKFKELSIAFDGIRGVAYYLVAIGFLGGAINKGKKGFEGITTVCSLLCICCLGFFIGIGEYLLSLVVTLVIYLVYRLKYIKIKILKKRGKK